MAFSKFTTDIEKYFGSLLAQINNLDRDELSGFLSLLLEARNQNRRIFIMGNGGSAATASHFLCDFNKGLSHGYAKKYQVICLNDNLPILLAYANDLGFEDIFVEQLKNLFQPGDLVVGISASGNSRNVVKAIEYANDHNGLSFALVGYDGGALLRAASYRVHVRSHDMQIVEDLHHMIGHLAMRVLSQAGQTPPEWSALPPGGLAASGLNASPSSEEN